MGIIGFLFGALLVIVIRGLQSLDPLWNPGVGIVFGTIFCAAFFLWGMGAFNPKLSQHGEGAEHHEEAEAEEAKPISLLSNSMWQIFTLLVLALIVLFAFALWGGLTLTITADPLASTTAIGYFTLQLPFGGPEIQLSELVVFVVFILWMLISLGAVGLLLAWLFGYLNRGLVESRAEASVGASTAALTAGGSAGALPSGLEEAPAATAPTANTERAQLISDLINLLKFVPITIVVYLVLYNPIFGDLFPQTPDVRVGLSLIIALGVAAAIVRPFFIGMYLFVFVLMYYVFYWVLIGMVLPAEPMRTLLSIVNALIFAFLLLRPTGLLQFVGRLAALLARFVRWLPKLLFQR
jgi:Na+-transporting methylmalonyl-CoA/oxaloacetate decarboxylase gamma subunit